MAARWKLNGTNNTDLANPLSPDTGSGYRLVPGGSGIVYKTAQFYEGTSSAVGDDTNYLYLGDGSSGYIAAAGSPSIFVDFFWRCSSLPGSDKMIIGSVYFGEYGAYVTSDGRLRFKSDGTTYGQSSASLLTANTWYRIRAQFLPTGSQGLAEVYVWTSNFTQDDPVSAGATQVLPTTTLAGVYVVFGAPMSSTFFYDDIVVQPTSEGNPTHAAGATTHEATATRATTATLSAAAAVTRGATASVASTASVSAAASVEKPTTAAVATTVAITATAEVVRAATATLATTATLTAVGDVVTPGSLSGDATVATTATITAAAEVVRAATATLATTATITADGTVVTPGVQSGTATVATTVAITATATVVRAATATIATTATLSAVADFLVPTTRGLMAGIDRSVATMTPITGAGNLPRRISLRAIDTATMTALLATTEVPALAGVPVFIGGDESPLLAGLVAAGTAYLWISDGVVYYEDGS